ncbi:MAG: hypothetical protein IJZ45_03925 [Bacteroidaceae bacterium]|nr:hypothetical protein [Bacteroidaceae bacterium]
MGRASDLSLLLGTHGSTGEKFSVDSREVMKMLNGMQLSEVAKRNDLRKIVRKEVTEVRKKVVKAAAGAMENDPKRARNAVLGTVYKNVIGGSVSLFDRKSQVKKMRVVKKKRGGQSGIVRNRYKSGRTRQIEAYAPENRGFILRFINKGTVTRTANGRGGRGNRGAIAGKNFFEPVATAGMRQAAENMKREVEKLITEAGK